MEFNPHNTVIQLCMQGINLEDKDQPKEALSVFLQAWHEATNDFEKFTAAWYVARRQLNVSDRLKWYEIALQLAWKVNNDAVKGAFSSLHVNIAKCYEKLGDVEHAKRYRELALVPASQPSDKGPFYHGTRADLQVGDLLTAGKMSNYQSELVMNHIYFTAIVNGAGLAAALARGDGAERVYIVEPTGSFEDDPNVTNKKFPGNPTRSYRTQHPLKIIGEATEWLRLTTEQLKQWREKLADNKREIIN
jgi:tetratricopeptide (TPR) repeat protein